MDKSSATEKSQNSKIPASRQYRLRDGVLLKADRVNVRSPVSLPTGNTAAFPGEYIVKYIVNHGDHNIAIVGAKLFDEIFEEVKFCEHGNRKDKQCVACSEEALKGGKS